MADARFRTEDELAAALEEVRRAPRAAGVVELIVRRPAAAEREVLEEATLDPALGLVGDDWHARPARGSTDGSPDPERQLTIMSARAIAAIAGERERWPLAGDQLYVDLDLGGDNLPAGTELLVGTAIVAVTAAPHTGCDKFTERFGSAASRWINTPAGRALQLRGINARVIAGGVVRRGDAILKLPGAAEPAPEG